MNNQLATTNIVMPAVSSEQAVSAWNQYEDMKKAIQKDSDIQRIGDKDFLKKSYWRKVATFFNLNVEVVEEKHELLGKTVVWHFTVKATAPNGRFAIGVGSCDAYEKAELIDGKYMAIDRNNVTEWGKTAQGKSFPKSFAMKPAQPNSLHNIRSTAETRATNRAISNLVGGGEVSAEEVDQSEGVYMPPEKSETDKSSKSEAPKSELYINEFQMKQLIKLGKDLGQTDKETKEKLMKKFNAESFDKILLKDAGNEIMDMIKLSNEKGKEKQS